MTEVYLRFYESMLPSFNQLNLVLQRDDPCLHLLHDEVSLNNITAYIVLPILF